MTFEELQQAAKAKRATLTMHTPVTGTYYQLRDSLTGLLIARRDSLIAIEEAIAWCDQP